MSDPKLVSEAPPPQTEEPINDHDPETCGCEGDSDWCPYNRADPRAVATPPEPSGPSRLPHTEEWTALDGSLTVRFLQDINAKRAERWHGLTSWSALEWAGAMAGEAGEACNAAKKLKRIEDGIANINLEDGRSLTDRENASAKIVDEIADTVIYGVLLASRVGMDLEEAIRMKFNRKSEEYGFPERIPANAAPPTGGPSRLRALLKAHFDISQASPLQHLGPCAYWRSKPCNCDMKLIQEALVAPVSVETTAASEGQETTEDPRV